MDGSPLDADLIGAGLEEIARIADELGLAAIAGRAQEARERLCAGGASLLIYGSYKRGKSTFVNALLGRRVLPSGVIPTTALTVVLRFGEPERAEVRLESGETRTITLDELALYATEKGNPENAKGVTSIEAFLLDPRLRDGLRIVDTPGFGSTHTHNTRAAREALEKADAIVVLLGADPPVGETEREFVRMAMGAAQRLVFVQNKRDLVTENELAEAVAFNRAALAEALGEEPEIMAASAREALEAKLSEDPERLRASGFGHVEQRLDELIAREGHAWGVGTARKRLSEVAAGIRAANQAGLRADAMSLDEIEERGARFRNATDELRAAGGEREREIRELLRRRVVERLDADIAAFLADARPRLLARMAKPASAQILDSLMQGFIQTEIASWREKELAVLNAEMERRLAVAGEIVGEAGRRAAEIARGLFDVTFEAFAPETDLPAESRFSFYEWQMRVRREPLDGIFPARLLKRARFLAAQQLEMHAGRSRHDFLARIDRRLDRFIASYRAAFEETVAGIESVWSAAATMRATAASDLDAHRRRLDDIERQIQRIEEVLR